MSSIEQAWRDYQDGIDRLRTRLLALDAAAGEDGAAQAHRLLLEAQAVAYNLVIAPDPRHPRLLLHSVFAPGVYDWLLPNPDFVYRYAFLDGGGRYRLTGSRGSSAFLDVQTIAGFFGDPNLKLLDSHPLDPFRRDDGTLDVQLSATPSADGGAWIPLAPDAINTVIVREAFNDWDGEAPAALHIAAIDPPLACDDDAATIARKLGAALRMTEFCIGTFGPEFCADVIRRVGENRFLHVDTSRDEDASNPGVAYVPAGYRLAPGEALVIAFELPRARYWSIHLADRWSRTTDYAGHQSSLNGAQACVDGDGRVRIVIATDDPGIANWLDPAGLLSGMMLLRWYGAERAPVPEVTAVPLDRLWALLPAKTARITPEARSTVIAARRSAIAGRYER